MITIIVREIGGGSYEARHEGRVVATSATPFCAAARVLLAEGHDPATRYTMRREGSEHDALISTLGAAAKLTVRSETTTFRAFDPHIGDRVTSGRGSPPAR
ncbi:MAG: hypothetical protein IT537_30520 [Hyphomicrobiales bacterium]|nr:hypothetical protein [Hyphomicrobiales bacterium]